MDGEELITTKSTLICRRSGKAIRAVTSGQDGVMAVYISEALELLGEMKEKYPGLSDILLDPNGSLYLNGEMYKEAIRFLEDCVEKHNGEINITDIFIENDLQMLLIREALGKLMPGCDERRLEKLVDGLMIEGTINGMDSVAGWDPHLLNKEMIEMLRRDSADTAERIETNSYYRWQEEHKKSIDKLADRTTELAYQALAIHSIMASAPVWKMARSGEDSKGGGDVDIPNTKPSPNQGKDPFRNADFKKSDIKMVNDAANQVGIDRKEFGNYIHEIKADLGMKANQNFTYRELLKLAEEYKKMTK